MIKADGGELTFKGNRLDLLSEFTSIAHHMIEMFEEKMPREVAIEQINECIETACMTDDEIHELAMKKLEELFGDIKPERRDKGKEDFIRTMMEGIMRGKE